MKKRILAFVILLTIMTLVSCGVAVLSTVYAICIGAALWECATVLLLFLLLNMEVSG